MSRKRAANKARNQTSGNRRGQDNAHWFTNNVKRRRRRTKLARVSKRRNRS